MPGHMSEIVERFRLARVSPGGQVSAPVISAPDPEARRRADEAQEEEDDRKASAEMNKSIRRMRQMMELRQLQAAMNPAPPAPDNGIATAIASMVQAGQRQTQLLVGEMRQMRQDMSTQQQNAMLQNVQALAARVEEIASARAGGTTTGLDSLSESLTQVKLFKGLIDEISPPAPVVDPSVTREQIIKQTAIQGEIDIRRRMEERKRREMEIGYEREKDERLMTSDRVARAFDSLAQIGTPLVEGITGAIATKLTGKGAEAATNGARPASAPAQLGAPAQNGHQHDPFAGMDDWQCPGCGVTNHSPPGTNPATCANCNQQWSLTPQNQEPGMGMEDPFGEFVNV